MATASGISGGGGGGGDPWAWLGLLKWSLSYTDGTSEATASAMSDEDRAFLEKVMKEGIIDENERMKTILVEVTAILDKWKQQQQQRGEGSGQKKGDDDDAEEDEDRMEELLQELRDIVEQIDYARAFVAMKGLPFLLGCCSMEERSGGGEDSPRLDSIPKSTRMMCLGILATLSQNNPSVQKELLESGAVKVLSDLYFHVHDDSNASDPGGQFRGRIVQAISAVVRSNELAEEVFVRLDQAVPLMSLGIAGTSATDGSGTTASATAPTTAQSSSALKQKTLFFLRALVTSDTTTRDRVRRFGSVISFIVDDMCAAVDVDSGDVADANMLEMELDLVRQILEQKSYVNNVVLPPARKDALVAKGVSRISALRRITDAEEKEYVAVELKLWEDLLVLLSRTTPTPEEEEGGPPLLLGAPPDSNTLAQ